MNTQAEDGKIIPKLPKHAFKKVIAQFQWKGKHYRVESSYRLINEVIPDLLCLLLEEQPWIQEALDNGVTISPVETSNILIKLSDGSFVVNPTISNPYAV